MDIGEVVKYSGLPPSTLRFYEEKGLIESTGRNGLRRIFDASVLERLALITLGRNARFSLEEIAAMFTPNPDSDTFKIDRYQLIAKADQLDQTIKQLIAMRDGLRHAAECPAPDHFQCPRFQRLMRIAVKNEQRQRKKKNPTSTSHHADSV
ncbi:MAG TPA: helix-turn-helix domain-containing protein [Phototrophicaceae bacterium]|nr:helix-turn-helix domain-containing protein [Phototrophicaceae bacterium]